MTVSVQAISVYSSCIFTKNAPLEPGPRPTNGTLSVPGCPPSPLATSHCSIPTTLTSSILVSFASVELDADAINEQLWVWFVSFALWHSPVWSWWQYGLRSLCWVVFCWMSATLSVLPLMDIWVVSSLGLWRNSAFKFVYFCEDLCLCVSGIRFFTT